MRSFLMKRSTPMTFVSLFLALFLLVACGGREQPAVAEANESQPAPSVSGGDPVAGKEKYIATCSACHGVAGEGVPGLGKDMTGSAFIADQTDQELVEFIKAGRDANDPLNTTGVAMPPKGGNLALTDQNLVDIVAYIRTLQTP